MSFFYSQRDRDFGERDHLVPPPLLLQHYLERHRPPMLSRLAMRLDPVAWFKRMWVFTRREGRTK